MLSVLEERTSKVIWNPVAWEICIFFFGLLLQLQIFYHRNSRIFMLHFVLKSNTALFICHSNYSSFDHGELFWLAPTSL